MTKVTTRATMSLDGYIADASHGGFEYLLQWYEGGDVETPTANPELTFRTSAASARHLRDFTERTGALVVGRRLFDMTNGWGGRHPLDVPVVVATHRVPEGWEPESDSFVFVTDGIESAVDRARAIAGAKEVGVNGGTIAAQVVESGLLDEVHVDLVPVVLGAGIPLFARLKIAPLQLEGPISVVEGVGVTHLAYRIRPSA
ncbi:dihydrofolate reductase family protein [Micromonospora sp. WMMD710]|uniref:dihydrofolate reductase family protein n=1 Tax=Micromonospora sp. WMMD710 TaxID=3016085 RepID=UPI00241661A5|nr:dihydrofolate reductase family protein [Micromonospora sp. WMMD710]MDG4757584.1 dihydrofolate reductase family protein [Micromonospora sp. WMMD710]